MARTTTKKKTTTAKKKSTAKKKTAAKSPAAAKKKTTTARREKHLSEEKKQKKEAVKKQIDKDIEKQQEEELKKELAKDIIENQTKMKAIISSNKKKLSNTFYDDEESYDRARISEHVIHIPDSLALTYMFQCGGAPIGRIIEFGGKPGTFKSTMSIILAVCAQMLGFDVWYFDVEHKQDVEFLEAHGLDLKPVDLEDKDLSLSGSIFLRPKRAEDVRRLIASNIESGIENVVYIIDSVTAMQNKYERDHMNKDIDTKKGQSDQKLGAFATYVGQMIKDIAPGISESYSMLFLVNQMRTGKKGMFFTMGTTGGNAITYYDSSKFITSPIFVNSNSVFQPNIADPNQPDKTIARAIELEMPKTSSGAPIESQYLFFKLGKGFHKEWELIHLGKKYGFIQRSKDGSYTLSATDSKGNVRECHLGDSLTEAWEFLEKDKKISNFIEDQLRSKMELPPRRLIAGKIKFWADVKQIVREYYTK